MTAIAIGLLVIAALLFCFAPLGDWFERSQGMTPEQTQAQVDAQKVRVDARWDAVQKAANSAVAELNAPPEPQRYSGPERRTYRAMRKQA